VASGTLISTGTSDNNNVRLDRVVYRDQSTRTSVSATLTSKSSENFLDGQFLSVSSRDLTILDLDGNLNTGLAGGVLSLDFGYALGLDAMGALEDPAGLPDAFPHAQFGKFKAGFNYSLPFKWLGKNWSFSSQFSGQKAKDTLYGSEQILIGGIYSVRGFVRNTLSGDDGYYWRNEISLRVPMTIGEDTLSTRLYAGYDTGEVRNRAAGIPEGRLAGVVIGLSGNWRGASWDIFNTRPVTLPNTMNKESSQSWFRVSYSF
jgi:hemolysin activation/secretion protein